MGAGPYPEHLLGCCTAASWGQEEKEWGGWEAGGGLPPIQHFCESSPLFPMFSFSQNPKSDRHLQHHPAFCFEQNFIFFTLPFY